MMKTIYEPKGRAKEYGNYALNIYTGCPHRCFYCYVPNFLHKKEEDFHSIVTERPGIVEATRSFIESHNFTGNLVHLCFTCDPYPTGYDSSATREIIKILKESGNHVQILTKGSGTRDFDLLDENDWYGVTLDGSSSTGGHLLEDIRLAKEKGIKTWVSFEPVVNAENVLALIRKVDGIADKIKVGKLNYYDSDIDWKSFGREAESLCKGLGLNYYIKEDLRKAMDG